MIGEYLSGDFTLVTIIAVHKANSLDILNFIRETFQMVRSNKNI